MAFRHRGRRRLLPKMAFRGSITRPAHLPAYASAMGSPPTPQDLGFPGRIPPGVGLASDVYSPSAHLLPPAGLPALSLRGQSPLSALLRRTWFWRVGSGRSARVRVDDGA